MRLNLPRRRPQYGIDISLAVVNIVLLLIFFFLLSEQAPPPTTDLRLSLTLRLPHQPLPSPVLVIEPQGLWRLNGQVITPDLLPVALAQAGQKEQLYLMMDRDAPASQLLAVMNHPALKTMQIRLITLRAESNP